MTGADQAVLSTPAIAKTCCAAVYESEALHWLLGDSFHPGGLQLTERVGRLLDLGPGSRLLDVACGRGASVLLLAERFGCQAVGVDMSPHSIDAARQAAFSRGLESSVRFATADAERLPFPAESFDAVLCECALCLFPDKPAAAREMARVLAPGGRVGVSDVVRSAELPDRLQGVESYIACIADARPLEDWTTLFMDAGLTPEGASRCDEALAELADEVRRRLFAAEMLVGVGKLNWPAVDFRTANGLADEAVAAIRAGALGYGVFIGRRAAIPPPPGPGHLPDR
jgi:ubiquinone/menaquinone biosynthesis C-methylase UbiE